jgi:hypothetical protein
MYTSIASVAHVHPLGGTTLRTDLMLFAWGWGELNIFLRLIVCSQGHVHHSYAKLFASSSCVEYVEGAVMPYIE